MEQLIFPDSYDLLAGIDELDELDCIYFLTVKSKFPSRYQRIQDSIKKIKTKTVIWDGKLASELSEKRKHSRI